MGYRMSCVVDHPRDVVFAWHERPGALRRLTPPWLPTRVDREAANLRDGVAVFAVPAGLRLRSHHQAGEYRPGEQFADVLHLPGDVPAPWHHLHRFEDAPAGRTVLVDEIDAPVPASWLDPAAAFRTRQLTADLDLHARLAELRRGPLTVGITGTDRPLGEGLAALLTTGGHRVVHLVRADPPAPPGAPGGPGGPVTGPLDGTARDDGAVAPGTRGTPWRDAGAESRVWDPADPDPALAEGLDAVVHLANAPLVGRYVGKSLREGLRRYVDTTAALARVAGDAAFVHASTIGVYGVDSGEAALDEDDPTGADTLAEMVRRVEAAAAQAPARSVSVRLGVVVSARVGVLAWQRPLLTAGVYTLQGPRRAWASWIALDDAIDVFARAVADETLRGAINAVTPHPVRRDEWLATVAAAHGRSAMVPLPVGFSRALLGPERTRAAKGTRQRVEPAVLREAGHGFRFPLLAQAVGHELGVLDQPRVTTRGW